MRQFVVILCLVLNLSVMLVPFDTTHAHIDSVAPFADVHSGHTHDLDHHHDEETGGLIEHVVDLRASVSAPNAFQSIFWSDWIPLASLVVLTFLVARLCKAAFTPLFSDPKPPSRHGYWRPPLRGPPAFSIR